MKLEEIKSLFTEKLSAIYNPNEIAELFNIFSQEILGLSKIEMRRRLSETLSDEQLKEFFDVLQQLKSEIPYKYILEETEFFGLKFKVSSAVLIPRPETEELLEFAINKIKISRYKEQNSSFKVLDIGTGSGIISIILKKHFPKANIFAIDFSETALEIAKTNANTHKTEINFTCTDYLNTDLVEKYDIIISNPPYIGINEEAEIEDSVKNTEPQMALFSPTSDALIFYKKIAKDAEKNLNASGQIFLEINQKLGKETLELFQNFSHSELIKDISGNDRIIWVEK
ncbi:peptide chain release factor N(5)-glutamine methyltransferase [Halpernia sp.]|uniref:peptide chain release factor N(5)-glutamine methyltransferase n=1 Tax=Halpernia sp. TaxID=2782209 RepID=UPI003A926531